MDGVQRELGRVVACFGADGCRAVGVETDDGGEHRFVTQNARAIRVVVRNERVGGAEVDPDDDGSCLV